MNRIKAIYYYFTHKPQSYLSACGIKPEKSVVSDMKKSLFRYGLFYEEYLLYDCIGRDEAYKKSFISELNRYDLFEKFNKKADKKFFRNKKSVYEKYKAFYGRDVVALEAEKDYEKFRLLCKNREFVFVKPYNRSCGAGVMKIPTGNPKKTFDELKKHFPLLCEEYINQSGITAKFNRSSLNTLRLVTIVKNEKVEFFYPFLRMGRQGSIKDNGGAGGIIVSVNAENGALSEKGRDESGRFYRVHPDSGVKFEGTVLPNWEQLKKTAASAALVSPECRLLGFDFAVTETSWVMVEANICGQFVGQQMCDLIGKYDLLKSKV